jgi:thioredoxin reductase (NADPH)
MENVIIIGSGCAGLTAALYTARADLSPLVITGIMPGGLLTTTTIVENYPGFVEGIDGFQLMMNMQKQAERFGARLRTLSKVESVDLSQRPFAVTVDGEKILTKTLIIATGAGHRHLGIESEHLLENKGVTYCATCDGALPMFRNKPLVVVGGGDSACEEAMYLTRFASVVYLVHRRGELRASKIMADRVLAHPKIQPVWHTEVLEILDVTTGIRLKNNQTNEESVIDCSGVFIAIGLVPSTELVKDVIATDEAGYFALTEGSKTNVPGVFIAGDCADKVYRQAITAAGMGCMAAIDAERFLQEEAHAG